MKITIDDDFCVWKYDIPIPDDYSITDVVDAICEKFDVGVNVKYTKLIKTRKIYRNDKETKG